MSALPLSSAILATLSANVRKPLSLATKSVSQLISTSTALPLSWAPMMRPSAATRPAFLSALARPCLRSHSMAVSTLPSFSTRAFLHSIMPAPERWRSSLTSCALICMVNLACCAGHARGTCPERGLFAGSGLVFGLLVFGLLFFGFGLACGGLVGGSCGGFRLRRLVGGLLGGAWRGLG